MHPVVIHRKHTEEATAYRFFQGCGQIDLGPNMSTSDMGIHSASMGGIWQCAVYGFGGVRVVGNDLHISSRLPEAWQELAFPLTWRGQRLHVKAARDGLTVQNEGKEAVELVLQNRRVTVPAGESRQV